MNIFKFTYIYSLLIFVNFLDIILSNDLCNYISYQKYQSLSNQYPEHKTKFEILSKIPLPIWITDRDSNAFKNAENALQNCQGLTNIFILYALPNKDCEAGFSSSGTNKNNNDYLNYINTLKNIVGNNEIIYIIEPDAIALSLDNKCGIINNYLDNIKNAINILSENINAKIYIDIGYWVLIYGEEQVQKVINLINFIDPNNKIKGISLNLSNYRKNDEMIFACNRFKQLSGKNYNCIIDTSRNWNGPSSDNQWCNLISGGIGELPSANPVSNVDYYLWLKPQSELDGPCLGFSNSYQINKNAGDFDLEYLLKLWQNGNTELQKCI
jgi:cellulase/cellobiase CelA1